MTGLEQVQRILERYAHQDVNSPEVSTCAQCKVRLQETVTGSRHTADGDLCSDCYFDAWGELVEQHPISSPRRR